MTDRKIKQNTKIPSLRLGTYAGTKQMLEYCCGCWEPGPNVLSHGVDTSLLIHYDLHIDLWWSIARLYRLRWILDEHTACVLQNICITIRDL